MENRPFMLSRIKVNMPIMTFNNRFCNIKPEPCSNINSDIRAIGLCKCLNKFGIPVPYLGSRFERGFHLIQEKQKWPRLQVKTKLRLMKDYPSPASNDPNHL
jgi:hypothetical protein